jgi:pimeloyl-ACP methyl ester carboxylesterase
MAATAALALGAALTTSTASAGTAAPGVAWHGCWTGPDDPLGAGLDAAGAQCGEVTVPVDYARPRGRTITLALARVRATDPARRRGVLMLNPGGPGGPAMELVGLGPRMPEVAAVYDLVGMDPRFVGRSSPIECRWTTGSFLRSAGPDRRTFTESVDFARTLADGCVAGNEALLPHASTRNTARDMDVVRRALGERRVSYLGYSYGTYLGAVYLQMFGAHADRFVLDSAVDPGVYGPNLLAASGPALRAALAHWAAWAAQRDSAYGFGGTADEVMATIDEVQRAAERAPLPVGTFTVDAHLLPYLILIHLYDDGPQTMAYLAEHLRILRAAARGEAVTPTPEMEQFLSGAGDDSDRAGTPVLCADRAASRDPESYFRDIQLHRRDEPLFGPLIRNITPCAFWPSRPVEAPTAIRNSRPALVVGADGDPITPYGGQVAMHRALSGSRMVTLRGRYAHTQYLVAGNPCVDGTVGRYLTGGVLPAGDAECALGS